MGPRRIVRLSSRVDGGRFRSSFVPVHALSLQLTVVSITVFKEQSTCHFTTVHVTLLFVFRFPLHPPRPGIAFLAYPLFFPTRYPSQPSLSLRPIPLVKSLLGCQHLDSRGVPRTRSTTEPLSSPVLRFGVESWLRLRRRKQASRGRWHRCRACGIVSLPRHPWSSATVPGPIPRSVRSQHRRRSLPCRRWLQWLPKNRHRFRPSEVLCRNSTR